MGSAGNFNDGQRTERDFEGEAELANCGGKKLKIINSE